jgi:hypothetical protein
MAKPREPPPHPAIQNRKDWAWEEKCVCSFSPASSSPARLSSPVRRTTYPGRPVFQPCHRPGCPFRALGGAGCRDGPPFGGRASAVHRRPHVARCERTAAQYPVSAAIKLGSKAQPPLRRALPASSTRPRATFLGFTISGRSPARLTRSAWTTNSDNVSTTISGAPRIVSDATSPRTPDLVTDIGSEPRRHRIVNRCRIDTARLPALREISRADRPNAYF